MITRSVLLGGLIAAMLVCGAQSAQAQTDRLETVRALFDAQAYVAAQDALANVDRSKLTEAEKGDFDRYTSILPEAIQGNQRAGLDLTEAQAALDDSRWAEAEALCDTVSANPYADSEQRELALQLRRRVAERRALADAAMPRGPIQNSEPQPAPAPTPAPEPVAAPTPPPPPPPVVSASQQPAPMVEAQPAPPTVSGRATVVQQLTERERLLWQRAVAKSEELGRQARQAADEKRFEEARQLADQALSVVEANRGYAQPASRYEAAREAALRLQRDVAAAREIYDADQARIESEEIRSRVVERRARMEALKQEKIGQLMNTARQLMRERRYAEAVTPLREILHIDPPNIEARDLLFRASEDAALARQVDQKDTMSNETRDAIIDVEEALIPWTAEIVYPQNWEEISLRRGRETLFGPTAAEETELNRMLGATIQDVKFEGAALAEVLDAIQTDHRLNLSVDWNDLEANGVLRDKPISLRLHKVSLRTVLNELLNHASGQSQLAYRVNDGVLRVASKAKLDREKFNRSYDIRDLLVQTPQFENSLELGTNFAADPRNKSRTPGDDLLPAEQTIPDDPVRMAAVNDLIHVIRTTVEPNSWRESGTGDASIHELNGQLVVYNTSDAQQQIGDLLSQLRETRALQIALEARFLTVTSNFLEEIGVDLDFVFNAGNAGLDRGVTTSGIPVIDPFTGAAVLVPRQYSRLGVTPAVPAVGNPLPQPTQVIPGQPFAAPGFVPATGGVVPFSSDQMTPVPLRQNTLALTDPQTLITGVPGSLASGGNFDPAMTIAGSFLDNLQVDFLIRATQANKRSSVVQAPRLVMFNGQRANIFSGTNQSYLASLQPQLAEGAAAFAPVIGQAPSGMSLDVEGTISADRKYVTVTVRAQQANAPTLIREQFQLPSGNSPGAFVTLVQQQSTRVNTTVSIPDGGTVLLGGTKLAGEIEVDAGVPILSKIPILKRAFTNTSLVKDTQTLLILMKAKIIIQREAEEEAFPMLSMGG